MKKLLLSLGLLLFLSLSLTGCNDDDDNAKAQGEVEGDEGGEVELDFLIDVISGEIRLNTEGDGFILKLEVSPITVFIEEHPGDNSGLINTEDFLENFNEIIGDVPPNAILTFHTTPFSQTFTPFRDAFPMKLKSVVFDKAHSVAEFLVTPLNRVSGFLVEPPCFAGGNLQDDSPPVLLTVPLTSGVDRPPRL